MTRNLVDGFIGHWPVATQPKHVVDDWKFQGDSVNLSTANIDKNHADRFCRTLSWSLSRLSEETETPYVYDCITAKEHILGREASSRLHY